MSTASTLPDWRRVANYTRQRRRKELTAKQQRRAAHKKARADKYTHVRESNAA